MDYYAGAGGGGGGGGGWGSDPAGSFWRGSDNNVWVSGADGVNSAGAWDDNSMDYWNGQGFIQISDPYAPVAETNTVYNTGGTSGSGTDTSRDLLQQGLNTGVSQLQGQLSNLNNQQQLQVKGINDQYSTTSGRLQNQYDTGQDRLRVANEGVTESKERSLGNLRDWLQGMGQGYSNQLGAMGAGDSSATGLINFALGKQGSRERGNILQDAGTQLNNLNMQGEDLRVSFENNMYDLDKWKTDNINQIGMSYDEARNQINNSITDLQQKAYAEMDLMQQAIASLQQLENNYTTQANQLNTQYSNLMNNQNIDGSLMNFKYSPVAQAKLNGLGMPNAVNPESSATAYYRRRDDEQLANPMGV
jgi:hypothetical protein